MMELGKRSPNNASMLLFKSIASTCQNPRIIVPKIKFVKKTQITKPNKREDNHIVHNEKKTKIKDGGENNKFSFTYIFLRFFSSSLLPGYKS
jgi:hypothetical protein